MEMSGHLHVTSGERDTGIHQVGPRHNERKCDVILL